MKTLAAINKNWIFWLDRAGIYSLPIGALSIPYLMLSLEISFINCVIGIVTVSFILWVLHHFCLRTFVKCPKCGWNLTQFKDGNFIAPKDLYVALKAGNPCLNCGWKPFEEEEKRLKENQGK